MKKFLALLLALVMSLSLVACGGGDEQQREDADEEQRRRAHLFQFDPPQFEGGQQKQQAVDAGRDGEGQEVIAEFAGEAEYHNAEELENKVHFGYLLCVEMNGGPSGKMGAQKPPSGVWRK